MEIADTEGLGDGDLVTVAGIIASVSRSYTKKGEPYAQFRLEDLAGGVDGGRVPGPVREPASTCSSTTRSCW